MKKNPKICFVSSSGGHWEQLQKLKPLADKYEGFFVTEKTQFDAPLASYFMMQTDLKDKLMPFKMLVNSVKALKIWIKEKPDLIISCGAAVAVPFFYIGKMMGAKLVYIEVFDRIDKPTMTGKMVYPVVDKFVVQWEEQKKVYPKAVNLGSIF